MKRLLPIILIAALIASCTPTAMSDADMATRVAQILTSQPTATENPLIAAATGTAAAVETIAAMPTTAVPSETPTEEPPSATPTEAATATPSPEPTAAGTATAGLPTLALTPLSGAGTAAVGVTPVVSGTPRIPITPLAATPAASFTPPANDPLTRLGAPTSTDEMNSGVEWTWPTGVDPAGFTSVEFKDGSMLLTGLKKDEGGWRLSARRSLSDFYLEMAARMEKCTANDRFGIIFRVPNQSKANQGYLFGITCDGKYYLRKWDGEAQPKGISTTLIAPKASPAIQTGEGQFNRLGILAVGENISLYINGTLVGQTSDKSYTSGVFGVFVTPVNSEKLTVRVEQMSYWENPKIQ